MGNSQSKNDELVKYYEEKYREWFEPFKIVSGPIGFTFFPNIRGRSFYLFKDEHTKGFECDDNDRKSTPRIYNIEDILEIIWSFPLNDEEKHDFFFESTFICSSSNSTSCVPIHWNVEKYQGSSILKVNLKFYECFSPFTKGICNSRYPSTRFHYTDYRFAFNSDIKDDKFKSLLTFFYSSDDIYGIDSSVDTTLLNDDDNESSIITLSLTTFLMIFSPLMLGGGFLRAYVENFFDPSFYNDEDLKSFINSEMRKRIPITTGAIFLLKRTAEYNIPNFRRRILKNVKNSMIGETIEEWFNDNVLGFVEKYEEIMTSSYFDSTLEEEISKIIETARITKNIVINLKTYKELFSKARRAAKNLLMISARLEFDAPTIGRMFKSSLVDQGSRFVWFYGGKSHADSIEDFLEFITLGETVKKFKSISTKLRCIKMPLV